MKKILRYTLLAIVLIALVGFIVRSRYVLDSRKLEESMKEQLPLGTPKDKVIVFIQANKPLFWDDEGTHVKARIAGRAGNLIYRRDIVLDFKFDPQSRLLSIEKQEYLSFL